MSFRREPPLPWMDSTEVRGSVRSVRSAWTNASGMTYESSAFADASETERSSINSSWDVLPKLPDTSPKEEPMTVEDAIDMYYGFDIDDDLEQRPKSVPEPPVDVFNDSKSTKPADHQDVQQPSLKSIDDSSLEFNHSFEDTQTSFLSGHLDTLMPQEEAKNAPISPLLGPTTTAVDQLNPSLKSISPVSTVSESQNLELPELTPSSSMQSPLRFHPVVKEESPPPSILTKDRTPSPPSFDSKPLPEPSLPAPRDRYGFKKATREVTVDQYDAWNENYSIYLERRRRKWEILMSQYGLDTEQPLRFPPKSDKVKRYVRKGIPPEWRGAAWFWYAGGQDRLNKEPGLYKELVEKTYSGHLSETDRDMIERDLHRTFPDSIKFKPDRSEQHIFSDALPGKNIRPQRSPSNGETRIVGSLRRVLQAFAIHNPSIGYCQSLNFLAGLLLLMLNENEEKSFILLEVITNVEFPGMHAKVLETVDIGVFLMCVQESMPHVWAKINDVVEDDRPAQSRGRLPPPLGPRLPTVHLALTPWFMSCFVNTLPIESALRIWDCLFFEGSKTIYRVALTIFKLGEPDIRAMKDQLEVIQVVQALPRRLLDINSLMEACFKRRNGFGHISQETIDGRRTDRRAVAHREQREREYERRMLEHGRERGMTVAAARKLAASTDGGPGLTKSDALPPLPPLPTEEVVSGLLSNGRPSMDTSRPATRDSATTTGDERPGRLRSTARKLRQASKSRRREKKSNFTDSSWIEAN
jgi:TBC1 domain family member 6